MVIAHNLSAMNAQRQYGIVNDRKAKLSEKLSSGYRINRAADDAAGLAISEKMRRQIRGLTQGAENTQDGVSLCQVADGALEEVQDILQRVGVLSVKAANGTNSESDRSYIQKEIDELMKEIDRIAYNTTFNEEIHPLIGRRSIEIEETGGNTSNSQLTSQLPSHVILRNFSVVNTTGKSVVWDGTNYNPGDTVQGSYVVYDAYLNPDSTWRVMDAWYGNDINGVCGFTNRTHISLEALDEKVVQNVASWATGAGGVSAMSWAADTDGAIYFNLADGRELWVATSNDGNSGTMGTGKDSSINYYFKVENSAAPDNSGTSSSRTELGRMDIWIQMGAEQRQGMYVSLVDASLEGLGLESVSVMTVEDAGNAIDSVEEALQKVSFYRTTFGVQQNRLEHGILINENVVENTTAAESQIRDTDMAKLMVEYSNINILQQAGQSVIAQANQQQRGVLALLQ